MAKKNKEKSDFLEEWIKKGEALFQKTGANSISVRYPDIIPDSLKNNHVIINIKVTIKEML